MKYVNETNSDIERTNTESKQQNEINIELQNDTNIYITKQLVIANYGINT